MGELNQGVCFSPLEGIVRGKIPFGTIWQVRGESGAGKSTIGFQFMVQGLRRGESAVYVACDEPAARVREDLNFFGFVSDPYEREGQLIFIDTYESSDPRVVCIKDRGDAQEFLYVITRAVRQMKKPCRVVLDSLTSLSAVYSTKEFLALVQDKNRLLREPDVVIMDIYLKGTLEEAGMYALTNAYDVCVDLFFPDERGGVPQRNLRLHKLRTAGYDPRPFPCCIKRGVGLVVDKDFYFR
ncbi:MAG: AAA family ATPase [Syntrophomonadaceae bacterium]|nr:AAA family ATPase [Syntrophomonadaceae bacterium]